MGHEKGIPKGTRVIIKEIAPFSQYYQNKNYNFIGRKAVVSEVHQLTASWLYGSLKFKGNNKYTVIYGFKVENMWETLDAILGLPEPEGASPKSQPQLKRRSR